MAIKQPLELIKTSTGYCGKFSAMASPCEILIDTQDVLIARDVLDVAQNEALRVEKKYSRYRDDNIIYAINNAQGKSVLMDEETVRLINYAEQCYTLSEGLFDITSGILRRLWNFSGGNDIPSRSAVKNLLPLIGWQHVQWASNSLVLPKNMEIDLGGLGKEYAVDRTAVLIREKYPQLPVLINYGGDLLASAPPADKPHWQVGIESIGGGESALIALEQGALTTSGDAKRFILHKGTRYPHVLNPRTGWPVMHAPHSVTVAAPSCIEAGFLATLAMLHGRHAQQFLEAQNTKFWIQR